MFDLIVKNSIFILFPLFLLGFTSILLTNSNRNYSYRDLERTEISKLTARDEGRKKSYIISKTGKLLTIHKGLGNRIFWLIISSLISILAYIVLVLINTFEVTWFSYLILGLYLTSFVVNLVLFIWNTHTAKFLHNSDLIGESIEHEESIELEIDNKISLIRERIHREEKIRRENRDKI